VLQSGGGNVIEGNFIGTDASGLADLGNQMTGVAIFDSADNTIGGTTPGARNIISGNGLDGIGLGDSDRPHQPLRNVIAGNVIGVDATGGGALGNDYDGIEISCDSTTVGGDSAGARNVISANGTGIEVEHGSHVIQGNYIGTNALGTAALGNNGAGV